MKQPFHEPAWVCVFFHSSVSNLCYRKRLIQTQALLNLAIREDEEIAKVYFNFSLSHDWENVLIRNIIGKTSGWQQTEITSLIETTFSFQEYLYQKKKARMVCFFQLA